MEPNTLQSWCMMWPLLVCEANSPLFCPHRVGSEGFWSESKRLAFLKYLVSKLDARKVYTENEMNDFLKPFHSDICTLRRELVINKLTMRQVGKHKVVGWNQ